MTAINRENKILGALIVTGVIAVAASGSLAWHRSSKAIPATQRISPGTTTASRASRDTQSDRDLRRMLAGFWNGSRSALKAVSKQDQFQDTAT
jgi:hypothetical protein